MGKVVAGLEGAPGPGGRRLSYKGWLGKGGRLRWRESPLSGRVVAEVVESGLVLGEGLRRGRSG